MAIKMKLCICRYFLVLVATFRSAPAPAPSVLLFPPCKGVDLLYQVSSVQKIFPYLNGTPQLQPYAFAATATITNMGFSEVQNWAMGIHFQHNEILVSAPGTVLADGTPLPALVGNGTVITGFPAATLKNAIETAGDLSLIQAVVQLTGSEFGVKPPNWPMPLSINITNIGYNCSKPKIYGNSTMHTCCLEQNSNITINSDNEYLPSETGNLTITFDVTQVYEGNYWALVTISNDSPLARLDYWNLTWDWQEGEFINVMQGAQTTEADVDVCLNGPAAVTYSSGLNLNSVESCSASPVIVDLPSTQFNTSLGHVQYCCRNGTILPAVIDPSQSKSAFTMNVYKIPPNTATVHLVPPANWRIGDGLYKCGQPRLITPTMFPDPSGILHSSSAVKTWQVTCNVSMTPQAPKCCVSFSGFYNDSIVPCPTCACGCPKNPQPVCNASSPALFLPYSALTLAPVNRTNQIIAWAGLQHEVVPDPLPCQDYCGISINWHIYSDYTNGWSARMTLFDWSNQTYPNWFAAVELDKAFPGFQQAYSFNATTIPELNNTILVEGLPGLNYLVAAQNFSAGKLQSVLSFTKVPTPGIEIALGDGFPSKVWFNGEPCALPSIYPSGSNQNSARMVFGVLLLVLTVSTTLGIL
ncbi:unnamed protein product [Sphagnum compactum]